MMLLMDKVYTGGILSSDILYQWLKKPGQTSTTGKFFSFPIRYK